MLKMLLIFKSCLSLIKTHLGDIGSLSGAWGHGNMVSESCLITHLLNISPAYLLLYTSQVEAQDHNEKWGILMFWGICQVGYAPSIIA